MKKSNKILLTVFSFGVAIFLLLSPFLVERVILHGEGSLWFMLSAIVPWGTHLVPTEKYYLTVVDDEGKPVKGADVRGFFYHGVGMKRRMKRGCTDAKGRVVLKGKSEYCDFAIKISRKGYYTTRLSLEYRDFSSLPLRRKGGRWIPYGLEKTLVLKKIKNPTYLVGHGISYLRHPQDGVRYGFDMEYGEYVEPFGGGKVADFYLVFERKKEDSYKKTTVHLIFPGQKDGLLFAQLDRYSNFMSPYRLDEEGNEALNGYIFYSEWEVVQNGKEKSYKYDKNWLKLDQCLLLRTRTECNEAGEIISAHYGKIYGNMSYEYPDLFSLGKYVFFNQQANENNLEGNGEVRPPQLPGESMRLSNLR